MEVPRALTAKASQEKAFFLSLFGFFFGGQGESTQEEHGHSLTVTTAAARWGPHPALSLSLSSQHWDEDSK